MTHGTRQERQRACKCRPNTLSSAPQLLAAGGHGHTVTDPVVTHDLRTQMNWAATDTDAGSKQQKGQYCE